MSYKVQKEDAIKPTTAGVKLEDGAYPATIVGYLVSKKLPMNADEEDDKFDAIRFALQLVDDEGADKVVMTSDMRVSLSERSTLFKQISSWCKSPSPEDLWDRLEKAQFMTESGELDFDKFLNKKVQLMVTMKASKKDPAKLYPEFTFTPPKVKAQHEVVLNEDKTLVPLWIPSYIEDADLVDTTCIEGFEWKRFEKKEEQADGSKAQGENVPAKKHFTKVNKAAKAAPQADAINEAEADGTLPF